jgi:hypothetical protein
MPQPIYEIGMGQKKVWTMRLQHNYQKFNQPPTSVITFPRHRLSRRESAVHSVRSAVTTLIGSDDPDTRGLYPCWFVGKVVIALCRPNESLFPGRWTLDIWTPEKKVLNVNWSSNNELDLEILSFRRGSWEQFLTDAASS